MLNLPLEEETVTQTSDEIARALYDGVTYDYALPQGWVDWCRSHGVDARGRFVWGYPPGGGLAGVPLPLTFEAMLDLGKLAS